ncbi:hypothetical protein ACT9UX_003185 [Escherichia coli]|nr:hypothetical protein [Escherichia coli]ELL8732376.1 hypothetical protein [Escherichia coli]
MSWPEAFTTVGIVMAAAFFQPEEVDVVREALNELSVDNDDAHAEIIKKMELLTH